MMVPVMLPLLHTAPAQALKAIAQVSVELLKQRAVVTEGDVVAPLSVCEPIAEDKLTVVVEAPEAMVNGTLLLPLVTDTEPLAPPV